MKPHQGDHPGEPLILALGVPVGGVSEPELFTRTVTLVALPLSFRFLCTSLSAGWRCCSTYAVRSRGCSRPVEHTRQKRGVHPLSLTKVLVDII